jgi:hypothetical protein
VIGTTSKKTLTITLSKSQITSPPGQNEVKSLKSVETLIDGVLLEQTVNKLNFDLFERHKDADVR